MTLDNLESTIFVGDKTFKGALQIDNSPGSEKVTNGAFTGNATGWTLGAQWAYGTNAVAKSGAGTSTLSQDVSAIADEIYKVVYTTSGISGGSITVSIGGVSGTARTTNATFTEYITATGTGNLTFTPASATAVTVDDVSVKRVGVAAADRVTAWVGDRVASGVEAAGDAGIFGRTEDGTKFFLGDRFGFGTWEPGYFLDVRGALNIAPSTSPAGIDQGIRLADPGTGASEGLFIQWESADRADMARVWAEGDTTGGILVFSTNAANTGTSTARMRINPSGALLINASATYADNGQLLEVNKSADDGGIGLFCWSATDAERPLLEFHKSASATIGTKALVADEEAIGGIIWKAADGATNWQPAASIEGYVDTAPGAGDMGGRLVFSTTADGAASVTEALRIDSAQRVMIGHTASITNFGAIAQVTGLSANSGLSLNTFSATAGHRSVIEFVRSKAAVKGTMTGLASADALGGLIWTGTDSNGNNISIASLEGAADGAVAGGVIPSRLVLSTTTTDTLLEALRIDSSQEVRALAGNVKIANATDGGTAGLHIRSKRAISAALSGATSNIAVQIPSGAVIYGVSFNVDTAIEGATSWSAAFNTGSTTSLGSGYALTLNTKVNFMVAPEKTTAATDITLTAAGSNFTAGVVEVVVYYADLTSMANA